MKKLLALTLMLFAFATSLVSCDFSAFLGGGGRRRCGR